MRRYETIVIVDPDIGEEQRAPVYDRIRELVPQKGGLVVEFDEWGARKMAYEVKKKKRGYYLRVDYCGTGELVNEIERQFRIDDRVLKYMTILLEDDVDMEAIQEKMSQASEAEAAPAATEAPAPAADTPAPEAAAAEEAPATAAEAKKTADDTEPDDKKEDA
ncbi:MAG: 30S ribosomal protein S6 [Desulfobacterales bacterium]|nr:30S ribosomal protein S6 [Desulfobacterales bacterium]